MKRNNFKKLKYTATIVLCVLYCFPVFSFAMGYSGFAFTQAALHESLVYVVLYLIPLACISLMLSEMKNNTGNVFKEYEKYSGYIILAVLVFFCLMMTMNKSFHALGVGYWFSLICGLIITFERRIHFYLHKSKN